MKQFFSYVKGRVRADKILTAIVFVFIAFCVGSGIYFGVIGQTRNCVMSFAYLLVVPVIYAVEYGVRPFVHGDPPVFDRGRNFGQRVRFV